MDRRKFLVSSGLVGAGLLGVAQALPNSCRPPGRIQM